MTHCLLFIFLCFFFYVCSFVKVLFLLFKRTYIFKERTSEKEVVLEESLKKPEKEICKRYRSFPSLFISNAIYLHILISRSCTFEFFLLKEHFSSRVVIGNLEGWQFWRWRVGGEGCGDGSSSRIIRILCLSFTNVPFSL